VSPARQFLVTEATRAALEAVYPHSIRSMGRRAVAFRVSRLIQNGFEEADAFAAQVVAEFHAPQSYTNDAPKLRLPVRATGAV
jgi:hypothetical protein